MLFRKKMPRSCQYCTHSTPLGDGQFLCIKRGVINLDKPCMKFSYDPCKRIPPKQTAPNFSGFNDEDFKL